MKNMKIKAINIKNFKGISELKKEVHGNVIYVSGHNGAGKSSVLEAIYAAISKVNLPEKPIKEGEKKAVINIMLEGKDVELEITRTITKASNSLTVKENGNKVANGRKLLDGLLSKISIDPFKFMDLPEKQQAELMSKVCGIDFNFEDYETKLDSAIEKRKELKRDITGLEGSIESIDVPETTDDTEYDVVALNTKLREANEKNAETAAMQKRKDSAHERADAFRKEITDFTADFKLEIPEVIDTSEIEVNISAATENADLAAKISMKKTYKEQLKTKEDDLDAKIKEIDKHEETKAEAMKSFKSPVKGLSTDGKQLILGDAPFAQASSAERIEVAVKLSMLANKEIKVINIKDASLLDDEMLKKITSVAKESDCQVFLEVVNNNEEVELTFEEESRQGQETIGSDNKKASKPKKSVKKEPEPAIEPEPEQIKNDGAGEDTDMFDGLEDF